VRNTSLQLSILCAALFGVSCIIGGTSPSDDTGGRAGSSGSGGSSASGGTSASGGVTGSGGARVDGGSSGSGGVTAGSGGTSATGGAQASGGTTSTGGSANGGSAGQAGGGSGGGGQTSSLSGRGGRGTGGMTFPGSGGRTVPGSGGATGTGGGAGGTTSTSTSPSEVDCNAVMPSGGTDHCGQNTQGKAGDLTWSLWSNAVSSSGLEFGNSSKTYDQYGTLKADFSFKKTGSGGGYSYIGIYGWTNNPCVEWYIVDDRFGTMPFNAYNASQKGTATIDGESYKLFQNKTNGTGGSRCTGVSQWDQYWSIRQTARQCGTITISEHFKAWEAAGLQMGGLLEAKILVETGGSQGSIEFPVANVTAK
jgi:endo-1,4-beta-xylanase